jgi:GntR family transcriptional regulator
MSLTRYIPQWRQIELALRERIATLSTGDPLPSDAELCAEFGVSRMTARNAMQRLADDGLVIRVPGRGSFVAEPPTHRRADRLLTFSREMERRGRHPSSRLLNREIRPSTGAEAAALGIAAGEPVVALRRLRLADEEPIAIETATLNRATGMVVMGADLEGGSLHDALARGGFHLRRGTATIAAAPATYDDARHLGLRKGDALLVERRVILDTHGRRIESTESRYPADRYALDILFDVEPEPAE